MTLEEAKLILAALRPDQIGELADPRVQQALDLAATDPLLAAWWETEQAFDLAFARKLHSVVAPPDLQDAIVRGAITIFMARRMIQDSTAESPASARTIAPGLAHELHAPAGQPDNLVDFPAGAADLQPDRPARRPRRTFVHHAISLSVAASFLFAILGVTLFFNPQILDASDAEIPAFAHEMADAVAHNPAPEQTSADLAELQAYLARKLTPAPAELPKRVGLVTTLGGTAESWHRHHVSHLFLRANATLNLHLYILPQAEFPHDHIAETPTIREDGAYVHEIWSEGALIFILIRPAQ